MKKDEHPYPSGTAFIREGTVLLCYQDLCPIPAGFTEQATLTADALMLAVESTTTTASRPLYDQPYHHKHRRYQRKLPDYQMIFAERIAEQAVSMHCWTRKDRRCSLAERSSADRNHQP